MTSFNWIDISYLQDGSQKQKETYRILTKTNILTILQDYDPIVIGTIPIKIDIPGSDIDIACCAPDLKNFQALVKLHFENYKSFSDTRDDSRQVYVAGFICDNMEIEIYAQPKPSQQQNGYLHMVIENRILTILGKQFCEKIIQLKKDGLKTEPAFGKLLHLDNPYQDLLDLEKLSDKELKLYLAEYK